MSFLGWILVIFTAFLAVSANVFLRLILQNKHVLSSFSNLFTLFTNLNFYLGFICYAMAMVVWMKILSSEPLSVAYPLLVCISFVFVTISASLLFKETFGAYKIIGLIIILSGITIMSLEK